jgi:5-methylcytosine-specific restriction protein A
MLRQILTAWDFQNRLLAILNGARQSGQSYVDVESGNLHKEVAGYPNPNHRMPVCCEVMRKLMRAGDSVLKETMSGQGATLTIRYTVEVASYPLTTSSREFRSPFQSGTKGL